MRGPRAGWREWGYHCRIRCRRYGLWDISQRIRGPNVWIVMALQQTVLNVGINSNVIVKISAI